MGPVSLNELNHLTKVHILPGIADNFFRQSPLLSAMKKKKSYRGGHPFERSWR